MGNKWSGNSIDCFVDSFASKNRNAQTACRESESKALPSPQKKSLYYAQLIVNNNAYICVYAHECFYSQKKAVFIVKMFSHSFFSSFLFFISSIKVYPNHNFYAVSALLNPKMPMPAKALTKHSRRLFVKSRLSPSNCKLTIAMMPAVTANMHP